MVIMFSVQRSEIRAKYWPNDVTLYLQLLQELDGLRSTLQQKLHNASKEHQEKWASLNTIDLRLSDIEHYYLCPR